MKQLIKLISPSNAQNPKSPYAQSTKNARETSFRDRSRRQLSNPDLALSNTIHLSSRKGGGGFKLNLPQNRSISNEVHKGKAVNKQLNTAGQHAQKKNSENKNSNRRFNQNKTPSSRRSSSGNEIDLFIKDIKSVSKDDRRNMELIFLGKWIDEESDYQYLISGKWMREYVQFLTGTRNQPMGPIDNKDLKQNPLAMNTEIYAVNESIWSFLDLLYSSGGSEIKIPNFREQKGLKAGGNSSVNDTKRHNIHKNQPSSLFTSTTRNNTSAINTSSTANLDPAKNMRNTHNPLNLLILTDELPSFQAQIKAPTATIESIRTMPLKERKAKENEFIGAYLGAQTKLKFFIDEEWIDEYFKYLKNKDALKEPGVIDNSILKSLHDSKKYHGDCLALNEIVWHFLSTLYGSTCDLGVREVRFTAEKDSDIQDLNLVIEEIHEIRRKKSLKNSNEGLPVHKLSLSTRLLLGLPEDYSETSSSGHEPRCNVCFEAKADTLFIPCGHRCCCYQHAQETIQTNAKCLLCKKVIEGFMKAPSPALNNSLGAAGGGGSSSSSFKNLTNTPSSGSLITVSNSRSNILKRRDSEKVARKKTLIVM